MLLSHEMTKLKFYKCVSCLSFYSCHKRRLIDDSEDVERSASNPLSIIANHYIIEHDFRLTNNDSDTLTTP